ncbi:hypothetical protein CR47_0325925 [Ralstonia solanacearum]|nr:hypothetical protein CR47_0325925 [Ralstonia solanacearum]
MEGRTCVGQRGQGSPTCRQQRAAGSASDGLPGVGRLKRASAGRTMDRSKQAAWWKWARLACG